MNTKYIFQGMLALVVASAGWSALQSGLVKDWLRSSSKPAAAIKFQNDGPSPDAPVAEAPLNQAITKKGPGGMRKCKKGSTVVYTDRHCPEGSQQKDIDGGSMTVVKGTPDGF